MKRKKRIITATVFIVLLFTYIKGCAYLPIEGTVVDAETKQPIEGAVVLAEWSIRSWFPDGPTRVYGTTETVADRNGRFKMNTWILRPTSDADLTIYKAGYVAWNNNYIFPGYIHRTNFKWENDRVYELTRFRKEYSYNEHVNFIDKCISSFLSLGKEKFKQAYRWEVLKRRMELSGEK